MEKSFHRHVKMTTKTGQPKREKSNKMSQEAKDIFTSIKKNKAVAKGTSKYTESEILDVIETLALNGFNYQLTSRETGIDRKTLRAWHLKRQMRMIQEERTKQVVKITKDVPIEQLREQYERSVIATKLTILKQMTEALPSCRNPKTLADALKLINDSITTKDAPKSVTKTPIRGSVLQMLANQINIQTNEQDNTPAGDSPQSS